MRLHSEKIGMPETGQMSCPFKDGVLEEGDTDDSNCCVLDQDSGVEAGSGAESDQRHRDPSAFEVHWDPDGTQFADDSCIDKGFDPRTLPHELPQNLPVGRWHRAVVRPQPLGYVRTAPDVSSYATPVTQHMPLFWSHTAQRSRATAAGFEYAVMEGPSPYASVPRNLVGTEMPKTMDDLTVNCGWSQACEYMAQYANEIARIEKHPGDKFRYSALEGGQDGWSNDWQQNRPEHGRFIWREGVNGIPEVVTEQLPDAGTEICVFDLYKDARVYPISDVYIVSMMALYGVTSGTACSMTSSIIPNYSKMWENHSVVLEQLRSKTHDFTLPRLSMPQLRPMTWPFRCLPKSVAAQLKAKFVDGELIEQWKDRAITDPGAKRQKRVRPFGPVQQKQHRELAEHRQRTLEELTSLVERLEHDAKKAKPGVDSPNACIPLDTFASIKYGSATDFALALDILLSAGLQVDIAMWDFRGWYEQFVRNVMEHYLQHQMVSSDGMSVDYMAVFGWADLCLLLNRFNYAIMDVIVYKLRAAQDDFDVSTLDTETRSKLLAWTFERREHGFSGDWFAPLPYFDDNSIANISLGGVWTSIINKIAKATWREYHMDLSDEKEELNRHDDEEPAPIIGRVFAVQDRQRRLPRIKVLQYTRHLDRVIAAARVHRRNLVRQDDTRSLFGRLMFAVEAGCVTMWTDFLKLLSSLSTSWSDTWVRLHPAAIEIMLEMRWKLNNENGAAFTPFVPAPLADGLPVVVTATDASLKTDFSAGYGGWIWLHGSTEVFYFFGAWDPDLVCVSSMDINELEGKACNIASELANQLADANGIGCRYVFQYGDSEVYFDAVAPHGRAQSDGLRFLCHEKSQSDQQYDVIPCTWAVRRHFNKPADSLSNADVQLFEQQILDLLGPVDLIRIPVPSDLHSIDALADWKIECSQDPRV